MAEGAQQIANIKRSLATAERGLYQKLRGLKRLLPAFGNAHLTPNLSCNTSYDAPPTLPAPTPSLDRREERAGNEPYYLNDQLVSLIQSQETFLSCIDEALAVMDDQLHEKAIVKVDHYTTLYEDATTALEDRIWFLCCHNRLALPGNQLEHLA